MDFDCRRVIGQSLPPSARHVASGVTGIHPIPASIVFEVSASLPNAKIGFLLRRLGIGERFRIRLCPMFGVEGFGV